MGPEVYHTPLDKFHRKLGRDLASVLKKTFITPNTITGLSFLVTMFAAWFFSTGEYTYLIIGAIVFELAQILDYTDGELARAKKMPSKYGAWLDEVSDFAREVIVLFGITFGIYRIGILPSTIVWIIGIVAIASLQFRILILYVNLHHFSSKGYNKVKKDVSTSYKLIRYYLGMTIALSMFLFVAINMIYLYLTIYAAYNFFLSIAYFIYFNHKFKKHFGVKIK